MKFRWYEEGGSVFSEEVKMKKAENLQGAKEFAVRTSIAFNVGREVGRHIADLHNQSLGICKENAS